MIVKLIHRPESAFRFYLDDTLDRFEYHLQNGEFPDDDEREEERLELYEILTDQQRRQVWGLSADLYSLLDNEQPPREDVNLSADEVAEKLQLAYSMSDWTDLLCLLRSQPGTMQRSMVDFMRYRAWSELGFPDVALAFIKNAIRLDPTDSGFKQQALELLKIMKHWESLAALAGDYASQCPNDAGVLLAVGESYHDLAIHSQDKKFDQEAVRCIQHGLEIIAAAEVRKSQIDSAVVTLSFALLHLERAGEGVAVLDKWIERFAGHPEFHAARGMIHLTMNYELAIRDFEHAVTNGTQFVLPYIEYANSLLHGRQYDDAIRVAESGLRFARRNGDQAKLFHMMAIVCAMTSAPERAGVLMREAMRWNPTDQEISSNLKIVEGVGFEHLSMDARLKLPVMKTRTADDLLRQIAA